MLSALEAVVISQDFYEELFTGTHRLANRGSVIFLIVDKIGVKVRR